MNSTVEQQLHQISGHLTDESLGSKSDNKENINYSSLPFSQILFVDEQGLGLEFAMKPCLERKTVRQLIERGGGHMTSNNYSTDSINLVTLNTKLSDKQLSNNQFYYLTLIYDSCKTNTLKDSNEYLFGKTTSNDKSPDPEVQPNSEDNDNEPLPEDVTETDQMSNKNSEQTNVFHEIDLKILELIGRRKAFADISGSRIWTKVIEDGLQFGPDWQSTKKRFFEYIMPNISNFSIEEINKNKFIEYYNRFKESQTDNMSVGSIESQQSSQQSVDKQIINNKEIVTDSNVLLAEKETQKASKDSISESDLDLEEESDVESNSKNIKTSEKFLFKEKANVLKKTYFNAYLDFMKQRETSNTPENLMRIKEALKVTTKEQKNESKNKNNKCLTQNPKGLKSSQSFGEKIVNQTRNESESQESGYKVSDISTDGSDDNRSAETKKTTKNQIISNKSKSNQMPKRMVSQKHRSIYTLTEDETILEFIFKTKRLDELKGNALWEEAEKEDICEGRSWQSMKERFRKAIIANIDSYDITKKQKQRIKLCFYSEDPNINRSQTGSYTHEEDMAIIKYVIDQNGYELVKGIKFWKIMHKEFKHKQICSRSFQSLKERYLKRIVPNLNKYEIKLEMAKKILDSISSVNESQKQLIFNKCKNSSLNSRAKKRCLDIRQTQSIDEYNSDTEVDEQNRVSTRVSKRTKKS